MAQNDGNLNLYLVELKENEIKYEFYIGFIVCCKNEYDAIRTHPSGTYSFKEKDWEYIITEKDRSSILYCPRNSTWVNTTEIDNLNVKYIGKASISNVKEGEIVIASYNGT